MAQAMLDKLKIKKDSSTQTGDPKEFQINLSENKHIRIYFSKTYKTHILSLNFGNCKKYIITKSMWKRLRVHLDRIDEILIS